MGERSLAEFLRDETLSRATPDSFLEAEVILKAVEEETEERILQWNIESARKKAQLLANKTGEPYAIVANLDRRFSVQINFLVTNKTYNGDEVLEWVKPDGSRQVVSDLSDTGAGALYRNKVEQAEKETEKNLKKAYNAAQRLADKEKRTVAVILEPGEDETQPDRFYTVFPEDIEVDEILDGYADPKRRVVQRDLTSIDGGRILDLGMGEEDNGN